MPVTAVIYDAAHKYGLDSLAFSGTTSDQVTAVMGTTVSQTQSPVQAIVNNPVTITATTSNGFTIKEILTYTSTTAGVISSVTYSKNGETLVTGVGTVNFSVSTFGSDTTGANLFKGADTISGNTYNNVLQGGAGNDRIDGGAGVDTAIFQGFASSYTVTRSGTAMQISGADGTDTLLNIERLQFDDKTIAYDTSGVTGQAYRLYQAALNRKPDVTGLGFYVKLLDPGTYSLKDIAVGFLASPEFGLIFGRNLSNTQLVDQLYQNVLHRAGEASGVSYHVGNLNSGAVDRAQLLVNFSESNENQAALIGTMSAGMTFS